MMNTHKQRITAPFLTGLVLGVLATVYLPGVVRPYLPQWVVGKTVVVTGTVAAKQKKENVLLLTVETPEGVLLATFKRKVDEINLLINEKDAIELTIPKYMPFIDDPKIIRVVKEQQAAPEPAPAAAAKPREQSTREGKPRRQERPPAAATAPSTTPSTTHPGQQR